MIKIGMIIGDRYEILEKIGTGGMSDVYKAKDHKLNRLVAVKVLKQEFSENANFVSKFRVEAQAAAGLAHPSIVNVYDVGEENGIYFIVMELSLCLTCFLIFSISLPLKCLVAPSSSGFTTFTKSSSGVIRERFKSAISSPID